MQKPGKTTTGLLLSGGLDSAVLLGELLDRGWLVTPFYVRTGSVWEGCELAAVERFVDRLNRPSLHPLVTLDLPLGDLLGDHWSMTGDAAPDGSTADEAVYLPGRNPLLLIKPALWCIENRIEFLAMATLANNPFTDATPDFFARFADMLRIATGSSITIARPFERLDKSRVLELGSRLPLELTFSCLSPRDGAHCGVCNKCAERRHAFRAANIPDKTKYAEHRTLHHC